MIGTIKNSWNVSLYIGWAFTLMADLLFHESTFVNRSRDTVQSPVLSMVRVKAQQA